jgi:nitroreductase
MELMEAIKNRQSTRHYEERPVPEDKLHYVLEAARLAPSASNRQRWKFIVVRDSERRRELCRAAAGQRHVAQAPVIIAAVATMPEYVMMNEIPTHPVDLAIAVDHMTLAAVDQGLGTCWIGRFDQAVAKDILKVPDKYRVVALLTLGFPQKVQRRKVRKSLEEIVRYETFEE